MPYSKVEDLPPNITKSLPIGAQKIWMRVFNNALSSCKKDRKACEDLARIAAWVAVKSRYKKDKEGEWVRK